MSRWKPDAQTRLAQAALELYGERGFDQTTVTEIAQRAGLTERTFFRHFADKREVLFGSSNVLLGLLVERVESAPGGAAPIEAIGMALAAVADELFPSERRHYARRRQSVITANTGLQERELIKFASMATAVADTLHRRGVSEPAATLAAEAGIAVFRVAFERWVGEGDERGLAPLIQESLDELRVVTGGR